MNQFQYDTVSPVIERVFASPSLYISVDDQNVLKIIYLEVFKQQLITSCTSCLRRGVFRMRDELALFKPVESVKEEVTPEISPEFINQLDLFAGLDVEVVTPAAPESDTEPKITKQNGKRSQKKA